MRGVLCPVHALRGRGSSGYHCGRRPSRRYRRTPRAPYAGITEVIIRRTTMTALQNLISLWKVVSCRNRVVPAFAWTGPARVALVKVGSLMQLTWLAIALVLVDRACAYLL